MLSISPLLRKFALPITYNKDATHSGKGITALDYAVCCVFVIVCDWRLLQSVGGCFLLPSDKTILVILFFYIIFIGG
jgi:hypothetical protein